MKSKFAPMMEVRSSPLQSARRTDQMFSLETSGPSPPISTGLSLGVYGNDDNNDTFSSPQSTEYYNVHSVRTPLPNASIGSYESTRPMGASVEYSSQNIPPLVPVGDNDFMSVSAPGIISGDQTIFLSPSVGVPPPVAVTGIGIAMQVAPFETDPQSDVAPSCRNSDQSLRKDVESGNISLPSAATGSAESGRGARDVEYLHLSMATQPASVEASAPDLNIGYSDGETQTVSDSQLGYDAMQPPLAGETQPPLVGETQRLLDGQEGFDDMVVLQNDTLTASIIRLENGDQHASYEPVQISGLPPLNIASFPASGILQGSMEVITEIAQSLELNREIKDLHDHEEVHAFGKNSGNAAVEEPLQSNPSHVREGRFETAVLSTEASTEGQGKTGKEEGLDTSEPQVGLSHEHFSEKVQEGQEKKDELMMSENGVSGNVACGKREVISEQEIQAIIGRKVLKKFGRKNYNGDVVDFDYENQWFKVVYEDGDEEDLELAEVKVILLKGDELFDTFTGKRKRSIAAEDASNQEPRKQRKPKGQGGRTLKRTSKKKGGRISKGTPKKKGSNTQTKKKTLSVESPSRSKPKRFETAPSSTKKKTLKVQSPSRSKSKSLETAPSPRENTALVPLSGLTIGGKRKRLPAIDTEQATRTGQEKKVAKSRPQKTKTSRRSPSKKGGWKVTLKDSAKRKGTRRRSISKLPSEWKDRKMLTDKKKDKSPGKREGKRRKKLDAPEDKKSLVGKIVEKDFDGTLYNGTVMKFDKKTEYFKVKYEDGDQEDLELEELMAILVE